MSRLFGTDGVRGIANKDLTPILAFNLGKAGTYVLNKDKERPIIIIGKDTRISGDMLEDALSAGILAMGGNVIKVGVLPTPAIAYLVKFLHADAGVMISASHNTFEYNGIKFFNEDGFKLDDDIEDQIEDIIARDIDITDNVTGERLGRCVEADSKALDYYVEFLKSTINVSLQGMKLVLDCANGAAYQAAKRLFSDLGAKVIAIADDPNGLNINAGCGSTHPEKLQRMVLKTKADMGFAFDGDADRLIAVDEKGRIIDGDKMICICARMMKESGALVDDKVTATVMSNLGFHKYLEQLDVKRDVTAVGDRYVLESMLKTGCVIGGEQSGHIIFLNYTTTGDGILSALQLLKAVKHDGRAPSEIADDIKIYPQVLKNATIKEENKRRYERDIEIQNEIRRLEQKMAGEGRVLIRPSGTEPLVRVMIEGSDISEITELAESLAILITKKFG